MKLKSAYFSAVFLTVVASLSACTAVPLSVLPPAPVGIEPQPVPDNGWTPYGQGGVPTAMPDRQVEETPGWRSAAVNRRDVQSVGLEPVQSVQAVAPSYDRDLSQPVDAVRDQGSSGWGSYRSTPVTGADSARPYSSRPIPKTSPKREKSDRPSFVENGTRVDVDPTWSARNVPASMRREVNTMVLQAARAGSAKWIGLDGRNYSATAEQGMPGERCVVVTLAIGQDERDSVGPSGNATVCPR